METGDAVLRDRECQVTTRDAAHLDQFVFSEDVVVADVSETTGQWAVFGPKSVALLRQALGASLDGIELDRLAVLDNRSAPWKGELITIVRRDDLGEIGF